MPLEIIRADIVTVCADAIVNSPPQARGCSPLESASGRLRLVKRRPLKQVSFPRVT